MKIVDLKHDLDEAIKIKRQIEDSFYEHHYNKIRRQLKRNKDAA
jgi:hypothetical protein